MNKLCVGRIILTEMLDPQGSNLKERPAVILEVLSDDTISIAAITTGVSSIPDGFAVELPWDRRGHPVTKLKKHCAVACHWLEKIHVKDIKAYHGMVPSKLMFTVLKIINIGI